jgi:hypothetical protein
MRDLIGYGLIVLLGAIPWTCSRVQADAVDVVRSALIGANASWHHDFFLPANFMCHIAAHPTGR